MDQNSANNSVNAAKKTVPSDAGVHRCGGLEDDDPAVWLDKFLKTNPDILNDQDESENNHDRPGNSGSNDLLRESEDDYDPQGQPRHRHSEARDNGESRTEEDKDLDSSNLPDSEPSRVGKSADKEDKEDFGRCESPYALMISSQEEIPRGNGESEIDSEDRVVLPGLDNLPSPPVEPILDDDQETNGTGNDEDESLATPDNLLDNGPSKGRRNDSVPGRGQNVDGLSPSLEATEEGKGGPKPTTPVKPLVDDDVVLPEPHESTSPKNQPGSGESSSDDKDNTPPAPPPSPSPSSEETDVEATRGNEGSQSSWTYASYLIAHFNMLYYLCMSPKKSDGSNPRGILNYVPFFMVSFVAVLSCPEYIKNHFAYGDKEQHIGLYYLTAGYFMNVFLLQVCFVYLLVFKFQAILDITNSLIRLGGESTRKMVALVVWVPSILTILVSILVPILYIASNFDDEWEMEDFILGRAFFFSKTLFVWTEENYENETAHLKELYNTNISTTTVAMAISSYFISIMGNIGQNVVIDTSLVLAFTMCISNASVEIDLKQVQENSTQENRRILWENYKTYRDLSFNFTECYWLFFQCVHLGNLLFVLYFLLDHVIFEEYRYVAIAKSIVIAKIIAFYVYALKPSSISPKIHKWIQLTFHDHNAFFIEGPEPVTVASILEELKTYPAGIGTGLFFIDRSFIYRFIGAIVSYFCFLSQTAQDILYGR